MKLFFFVFKKEKKKKNLFDFDQKKKYGRLQDVFTWINDVFYWFLCWILVCKLFNSKRKKNSKRNNR